MATTGSVGTPVSQDYWWYFPKSDCGNDDVAGTCKGKTVAQCEAQCLATKGCGGTPAPIPSPPPPLTPVLGFNYPHGVLKKTNCLAHKAPQGTVDLYVLKDSPQPPPPSYHPPIWPRPKAFTNGTATVSVGPAAGASFFALAGGSECATLTAAFERYAGLTFPHVATGAGAVSSVLVTVKDASEHYPQLETDESYSLDVPLSGRATLQAGTVYGALRGLETLSQMVRFNFTTQTYSIAAAPWAITDAPRFPHRGLMVDTARHFQTLASLRTMIDSLPYAKMNVLHWHMSDDQSFPLVSKTHPKLSAGSYSAVERYEQADIAEVVEYARLRGVRVMVEFDMPGHASSWCAGYPEVCPSASCKTPLNVANNATFELITDLLGEMTGHRASAPGTPSGLFPLNMIHLGGDEVNTRCWSEVPAIRKWLAATHRTADDGYAYFVKRAAEIAIAQGRRPVQWVEVFDHFHSLLDKRTIVHVWKAESTLNEVVAAGYNALIDNSPGDNSWYLDHLDITWDKVYGNEPCSTISDAAQCALVLGGQGEMWGETVDASDIQSTVWPRLGAIAERLWTPRATIGDAAAAAPRMHAFRCLLNRRGIAAAPVDNAEARAAPPGAGGCLDQ